MRGLHLEAAGGDLHEAEDQQVQRHHDQPDQQQGRDRVKRQSIVKSLHESNNLKMKKVCARDTTCVAQGALVCKNVKGAHEGR